MTLDSTVTDARYAKLFEPVKIGPVTTPNRFFQVPHCNGMAHLRPNALAAMRGIKAEGGWGVVSTEEVEIHPTGDISPSVEGRLWSDDDIAYHAKTVEAIHAHGSLAAIQLAHNGFHAACGLSRLVPMGPSHQGVVTGFGEPVHARAMSKQDIVALRGWYRDAARRAQIAGYDIVYVYSGHNLTTPMHFLSARYNDRTDEYGGSVENRARLIGELLEDVKEEVGQSCGVAFRFGVDELMGPDGINWNEEGRAVVEMFAELPDLWDVNLSGWSNDSQTARFAPIEGFQTSYTKQVKSLTSKPVVGVGRFTSADTMIAQINNGHLDLIGAARPSIADPFLPAKIRENRIDEIRECIGCNICVTGDNMQVPIRCTQNPTMGEEWRRGWHPERIAASVDTPPVLIVGAGPAGLEAALQLSNRGHPITLAEARDELGGRVSRESQLPRLASYARVRDYRTQYLLQRADVEIYRNSDLTADDILGFGYDHVLLATGARWRRDGIGRDQRKAVKGLDNVTVLTPDDVLDGVKATGNVLVYDLDYHVMATAVAEKLRSEGHSVAYATDSALVAQFTNLTLEQGLVHRSLHDAGVEIHLNVALSAVQQGNATLHCTYTNIARTVPCDTVVLVTDRLPKDELYQTLSVDSEKLADAGINTLHQIGDCFAPGSIAAAVYSGHKAARLFPDFKADQAMFNWERPAIL
ncbi:FAD-dependent oxidoreductase [Thioclava sp.]|uniref:oxidoreductase n=1 Tax=Thioclava sp. TaxID=1933450 RepID=UPI003AA91707